MAKLTINLINLKSSIKGPLVPKIDMRDVGDMVLWRRAPVVQQTVTSLNQPHMQSRTTTTAPPVEGAAQEIHQDDFGFWDTLCNARNIRFQLICIVYHILFP